jgi:4-diphosphocytidyl-2-C-methyl-D-erythritol kinase
MTLSSSSAHPSPTGIDFAALIEDGFQAYAAPAKVNLFLHIVGRRADGYHLLQSVFQLIDLQDTIYLKVRQDGQIQQLTALPNTPYQQDLTVRAAQLLQRHCGCQLGVSIAVDKRIPIGAGLGGGSSDAASVLIALNQLWGCQLKRSELMQLGEQLGADVPFFIFGQNAWVEGIGEQLTALTLPAMQLLILTPPIQVSTAQIFQAEELTRNTNPTTIAAFLQAGLASVLQGKQHNASNESFQTPAFGNDLSDVVCRRYPAVKACLDLLSEFGQARMSGSGASVFIAQALPAAQHHAAIDLTSIQASVQQSQTAVFSSLALGLAQHPLYNLTA